VHLTVAPRFVGRFPMFQLDVDLDIFGNMFVGEISNSGPQTIRILTLAKIGLLVVWISSATSQTQLL
jgi:hypothetical protein